MTPPGRADTVPTGTYWDQLTWDLARSAYVADLDTDPDAPDAFVGWLQRALSDHAARTPDQRAHMVAETPTTARGRGFSKTYPLRADIVDALERAIIADRQALGRMVSRSGFIREAVTAAAGEAQARLRRPLPPPPGRLPTRPPRRR